MHQHFIYTKQMKRVKFHFPFNRCCHCFCSVLFSYIFWFDILYVDLPLRKTKTQPYRIYKYVGCICTFRVFDITLLRTHTHTLSHARVRIDIEYSIYKCTQKKVWFHYLHAPNSRIQKFTTITTTATGKKVWRYIKILT